MVVEASVDETHGCCNGTEVRYLLVMNLRYPLAYAGTLEAFRGLSKGPKLTPSASGIRASSPSTSVSVVNSFNQRGMASQTK